jgi:hypothetical protein
MEQTMSPSRAEPPDPFTQAERHSWLAALRAFVWHYPYWPTGAGWQQAQAWIAEADLALDLTSRGVPTLHVRALVEELLAAKVFRPEPRYLRGTTIGPPGGPHIEVTPGDNVAGFATSYAAMMHFLAQQQAQPPTEGAADQTPPPAREKEPVPPRRHGVDFRSVDWDGATYKFTKAQAACVGVLWQAMDNGTPEMDQATLLEEADLRGKRLIDVFRKRKSPSGYHPAWATMIVAGSTKGSVRLAP